ncbi:hypothetical protein [Sagittula sp. S175]|uniref:hypothetical protein n=1 Tax=Sagittula sp. S175 TaxID=3415129 RepID=UPI003C7D2693
MRPLSPDLEVLAGLLAAVPELRPGLRDPGGLVAACTVEGGALRLDMAALGGAEVLADVVTAARAEGLEVAVSGDLLELRGAVSGDWAAEALAVRREPRGKAVVEISSAYPTAPLGLWDIRLAVISDSVAEMLLQDGWAVTREYFSNDAGQQVATMARSVYACAAGYVPRDTPGLPAYVFELADALKAEHGDSLFGKDEAEWLPVVRDFAVDGVSTWIRDDLRELDIDINNWVSERALWQARDLDALVEDIGARLTAAQDPEGELAAMVPLLRDGAGRPTYLAADIGYHLNKIARGFTYMVDLFREDHSVFRHRLQSAVDALAPEAFTLAVRLVTTADDESLAFFGEVADPDADADIVDVVAVYGIAPVRMWALLPGVPVDEVNGFLPALNALRARCKAAPEAGLPETDGDIAQLVLVWPLLRRVALDILRPEVLADVMRRLVNRADAIPEGLLRPVGVLLEDIVVLLGLGDLPELALD